MVLMPEPVFRAVEAGRGRAGSPRPAAPPGARRPALRPRRWPRSWRPSRGLLAAVRPLRGRRPAGERPSGRRRALGGRLRAGRRGAGGPGRDRDGGAAAAGGAGQRGLGRSTRASPRACSSTPSTPARPSSGAGRCPRCCARAITPPWPAWRRAQSLLRTAARRPDLLERPGQERRPERRRRACPGRARLPCSVRH